MGHTSEASRARELLTGNLTITPDTVTERTGRGGGVF